jgi:hypothetical protein
VSEFAEYLINKLAEKAAIVKTAIVISGGAAECQTA